MTVFNKKKRRLRERRKAREGVASEAIWVSLFNVLEGSLRYLWWEKGENGWVFIGLRKLEMLALVIVNIDRYPMWALLGF